MLQLQQEDILKAARGNAFTNSLLNQQKKWLKLQATQLTSWEQLLHAQTPKSCIQVEVVDHHI